MKTQKHDYFISDSQSAAAAFAANWPEVEGNLQKILPLLDSSGTAVNYDTPVSQIDFSKVAACLPNAVPDIAQRFVAEANKKDANMKVADLLDRPAAEITRWRKMGNNLALLPNAIVLHMNLA